LIISTSEEFLRFSPGPAVGKKRQNTNLSSAECTSIGYFNSFVIDPPNTVILYTASKPILRFDLLNRTVQPTLKIQPLKSDVCDGDEITIDGFKCTMMEIKPLGP
jgi:hypothetical protein